MSNKLLITSPTKQMPNDDRDVAATTAEGVERALSMLVSPRGLGRPETYAMSNFEELDAAGGGTYVLAEFRVISKEEALELVRAELPAHEHLKEQANG